MSSNKEQNDTLNALIDFLLNVHSDAIQWNPRGLPCLEGVAESDYRRTLETVILDESQHYKAPFTATGLWTIRLNSLRRAPSDETNILSTKLAHLQIC
ncbi:hypothetical protein PILCRDRAFT_449379 [Piloderma croceum F 1598]|uniref:Uncharacterized protein n=1 Tax=Piloderma croceum (strain F 1598) TaxID=765440 RepID=A0A0C3FEW1_PILCF|nr:hypothetical protein PILCRDRAFT_449379 [Piloderma croceum F 1598]